MYVQYVRVFMINLDLTLSLSLSLSLFCQSLMAWLGWEHASPLGYPEEECRCCEAASEVQH